MFGLKSGMPRIKLKVSGGGNGKKAHAMEIIIKKNQGTKVHSPRFLSSAESVVGGPGDVDGGAEA